jgi:hypothetical protein
MCIDIINIWHYISNHSSITSHNFFKKNRDIIGIAHRVSYSERPGPQRGFHGLF